MALMYRRSKSVSNTIETPSLNVKDVRNCIVHRYKTCSSDKLYTNGQSEVNTTLNVQKSPKFIAKLVASLEKKNNKNGDFNADDEFLTKCYSRPSLPKINLCYPNCDKASSNCKNDRTICQKKSSLDKIQVIKSSKKNFESPAIRSTHVVNKNWTDITKESGSVVNEGKVNRKKSIKGMLSSIMGWKKHIVKEKSGRFWSRDDVSEKYVTLPTIPRARSLQTFVSNNTNGKDKHIVENLDRNATIRPFYGNRRSRMTPTKNSEFCHQIKMPFKEDSGYVSDVFSIDETSDSLVKPSAVREIAKRLSYHPKQSWNKKSDIIGPCPKVSNDYKENKSTYRRKSFVEEISHIGNYRSLDLANNSIYTLPVTRKLKDEYLSVLANNK